MEDTTCVIETLVEISTEQRRSSRLCTKPRCGLTMKYWCYDNNGSANYKGANDVP
jgi:hypothetical protein